MCHIPSTARSNSNSETPGETGSVAAAFAGKDYYQELISRANTVPITKLFRHYGIRLDEHNKKTACPFKSHAGGRERSPSFWYYPHTNTFHCFGCHKGPSCCDFVVEMEQCTKVQAAQKILHLFESDVDEDNMYNMQDFDERLKIMMDFSNTVREFYQTYSTEKAGVYVEQACKKFDTLNLKKKLNNEALSRTVEKLKEYINLYKP
jgi:DNA primase